uniref:Uncharacterized protein n=1 Tax=Rhizophora mucronata TaxID=61149 RepID=A0A2P2J2N1_RHIMU
MEILFFFNSSLLYTLILKLDLRSNLYFLKGMRYSLVVSWQMQFCGREMKTRT